MSDQDQTVDMKKTVLVWVAGQPFNNVLILIGLLMIAWIAHYTVTVAEPARLKNIQEGYQRIEESNSKDRLLIIQQYDKWFDHIQQEHKGLDTGHIDPSLIFDKVWSSENGQHTGIFGQQIANVGSTERDAAPPPDLEYTTEGGTVVSVRSSGNSAAAKLRWPGRESRCSNGSPSGRTSGGPARASGVDLLPFGRNNSGVVY